MCLRKLARSVWVAGFDLSFSVSVGGQRPFSDAWFADHYPQLPCGRDSREGRRLKGWYWIATDVTIEKLASAEADLPLPERRPKGTETYRSIGDRATKSLSDIGPLISSASIGDLRVIYNGHEGWARGRLGGHFYTANISTGALRISQHPGLRDAGNWVARIFTEDMVSELPVELRTSAANLVASKLGRNLVELEWRSIYGWPLLCKG